METKDIMLENLISRLHEEYNQDNQFKFSDEFLDSGFIEYEINSFLETHKERIDVEVIDVLLQLSWYSTDRLVYSLLFKKDGMLAQEELSRAASYAFYAIYFGASACRCFQGMYSIPMQRISLLFSLNILTGHWNDIEKMGNTFVRSLNAENCIIRRGNENALRSWFLIDLYDKLTGKKIDKRKARYPEEYGAYGEVFSVWDSKDLYEINKMVSILCDLHLILATSEITPDNEDERKAKYEIPVFQVLPYEILAWLAIRKQHGLENPTEYSHPLMNTPIAQFFLNLETPLPKPEKLPYVKELLTKLKEKCPEIEINL